MTLDNDHQDSAPLRDDDPRLTAYALDELDPESRAEVEALLENDPAARAEVDALRALAGDLEGALAVPPGEDDLQPLQRERIRRRVAGSRPRRRYFLPFSIAACVLLAVGAIVITLPPEIHERSRATGGPTLVSRTGGSGSEASGAPSGPRGEAVWRRPRDGSGPERARRRDADSHGVGLDYRGLGGKRPPGPQVDLDEVTGSLENSGSSGRDNAGSGLPAEEALDPTTPPGNRSSGAYPNPKAEDIPTPSSGSGGGAVGETPALQKDSSPGVALHVGSEARGPNGRFRPNAREATDPTPPPPPPQSGPPVSDPAAARATGLSPANVARYARPGLGGLRGAPPASPIKPTGLPGTEGYLHPGIDRFHRVTKRDEHTSTFSVDVDTASYTNLRRMLRAGQRPPPAAVRIEEIVNYFDYAYAGPGEDDTAPFRTHVQVATCPWNPRHRLARIAIKGREIHREQRPAANLVFLVDVSGSMQSEDKLPLVRTSLELLVEQLRDDDRVAIVTYASSAQRVLASTPGSEREAILAAIRALKAGGSTNGAGGIQMAYQEAAKGFREGGVNRVLLCTDGDFNVGVSDTGGLVRLIEAKAKSGVFLSVLGYGTGNYKDDKMEAISNRGNGTYAYVDGQDEARRVLVEQMSGTLMTIAKDVKFQLWFNPRTVAAWRLLGYENRRLAAADFNDDHKDAGDIGAGHEVTALYEIVPTGADVPGRVDANPFVERHDGTAVELHPEDPTPDEKALFIWRLRWKAPEASQSTLIERNVFDDDRAFEQVDRDFQWAAAATAFGMLLRNSPHAAGASWDLVEELARPAVGPDPKGRRAEFLELVERARALDGR